MSSNTLVFQTSGSISSLPAAFIFLFFQYNVKVSLCKTCSFDVLSAIDIFGNKDFSVIYGGFPIRFLKRYFYLRSISFWRAAFCIVLYVLFYLLTSFSFFFDIYHYLSPTKFLLLSICLWMYSNCNFCLSWIVLSVRCHLLGFILFSKDTFWSCLVFFF